MIILKNVEYDDKTTKDRIEIDDYVPNDDPMFLDLQDYLDGDYSNFDGIIDYVNDHNIGHGSDGPSKITSCEIYAAIAISFTNALYHDLYDGADELTNQIQKNDLYDCLDQFDYILVEVPLKELLEYYEKEIDPELDGSFSTWYTEEYTTDHTNDLLDHLVSKGINLKQLTYDGQSAFDKLKQDVEYELDPERNF